MSPVVWVVASEGTAWRWGRALDTAGVRAWPLAWSRIASVGAADVVAATLRDGAYDLVLLTSPNALAALPSETGRGYRAACVGETTAEAARGVGFEVGLTGAGTGEDLAGLVIDRLPAGRLLFLRGREVRREGIRRLEAAGWEVTEIVVYEAVGRSAFGAEVRAAPRPTAIVVGSPRAAEALHAALAEAGRAPPAGVLAAAVGETTARRLLELDFGPVAVPEVPGVAGLLQILEALPRTDASP